MRYIKFKDEKPAPKERANNSKERAEISADRQYKVR
jgi:hypothetical protein